MMFELDDEDQIVYDNLLRNGTVNERYVADYYKYELEDESRKKINDIYYFAKSKFMLLDFKNFLNIIDVLGENFYTKVYSPYKNDYESYFKVLIRQLDPMCKSVYHISATAKKIGGTRWRYNNCFESFLEVFDIGLHNGQSEINELRRVFVDYLGTFVNNKSIKDFSNGEKRSLQYYLLLPSNDSKYKRDKKNYSTFTKIINNEPIVFVDNNNEIKILLEVVEYLKNKYRLKLNSNILRFILNRYDELRNSGIENDDARKLVIDEIYDGKLINSAIAFDLKQKYLKLRNGNNSDLQLNID